MVKNFLMLVALSTMFPLSCFAWMHDDTDRWVQFGSTKNAVLYLDTETVKFPSTNIGQAWIAVYYPQKKKEQAMRIIADFHNETINNKLYTVYREDGTIFKDFNGIVESKTLVIPGSIGETIYKILLESKDE